MPARTDPRIPELVSLTEAAEILGCSKNWITKLHQRGRLRSYRVGRTLVLAAAPLHALATARRDGQEGWQLPDTAAADVAVPKLLSTTDAAELLGLTQRVWIGELYRRGDIPGQQVGRRNIIFAADTITEAANKRRTGRRHDRRSGSPD